MMLYLIPQSTATTWNLWFEVRVTHLFLQLTRATRSSEGFLLRHPGLDDSRHRPARIADHLRQQPGVDAAQARDSVLLQFLFQGLCIAEIARSVAAFPYDKAADRRRPGLEILVRDPVVPDEGIGHHDNLFSVRRIGEDLLIPDYGRVENDFADLAAVRSEPSSVELPAVFQHKFLFRSFHVNLFLYIPSPRP